MATTGTPRSPLRPARARIIVVLCITSFPQHARWSVRRLPSAEKTYPCSVRHAGCCSRYIVVRLDASRSSTRGAGSEPSWPHGPAKAISRDGLPARSAFCPRTSRLNAELPGKVVRGDPVTVAAVMQHSQSAKLQKKQLEHRLGLLKHRPGRRSESPVTWQVILVVACYLHTCI